MFREIFGVFYFEIFLNSSNFRNYCSNHQNWRMQKNSLKCLSFPSKTHLLSWWHRFPTNQALLDSRSTALASYHMTTRLENSIPFLFRAEKAFVGVLCVWGIKFRLLRLLLTFVIHNIVADVLFVHCRCLDVFGVLFIVALDEYFTQVWITVGGQAWNLLKKRQFLLEIYGQRSKGVWSFRFLTVKSAPFAARKQAMEAEAFLSVFWRVVLSKKKFIFFKNWLLTFLNPIRIFPKPSTSCNCLSCDKVWWRRAKEQINHQLNLKFNEISWRFDFMGNFHSRLVFGKTTKKTQILFNS